MNSALKIQVTTVFLLVQYFLKVIMVTYKKRQRKSIPLDCSNLFYLLHRNLSTKYHLFCTGFQVKCLKSIPEDFIRALEKWRSPNLDVLLFSGNTIMAIIMAQGALMCLFFDNSL